MYNLDKEIEEIESLEDMVDDLILYVQQLKLERYKERRQASKSLIEEIADE